MTFELGDSLLEEIIYSMEDQDTEMIVDAEEACVLPVDGDVGPSWDDVGDDDSERYYDLPEWTSSDGFELLRDFTNSLHSPLAREDLKRALNGGRGVFRRFKDVIRSYPEVERKFFVFKENRMKARVVEWYNGLRESWGMEKLEFSESDALEETEELVLNDFVFREYDPAKDGGDISRGSDFVAEEYARQFSQELGEAVAEMWRGLSGAWGREEKFGSVCRSHDDEFTGCLLFSFCPPTARTTVALTDFFVLQDYRGLGIGEELLSKSLPMLKGRGIQWVLISNTIVPEPMERLLERFGFDRLGSGYLADLTKVS
jgi:GNAT superfamily N-acetyltransferase